MKQEAIGRGDPARAESASLREEQPAARQNPAAAAQEIGRCPNCGGSMREEEKGVYVCPYCGTKTAAADAQPPAADTAAEKRPVEKRYGRGYFTASRIAKLAMFTALAYVVTFLEFPIFPAAPFLQLDFSNVFVLLSGFMYGPVAALIVSGAKELLSLLDSGTGGVGEVANFLITFCFVIVPTLVYRRRKGLKTVLWTLAAGCVLMVAAGLVTNRFINFPLYMGAEAASSFAALWWYIVLFNLIKGVALSAVTVLLYKRVSWLLKKF